jgi:hypothetical protein
MKRAVPVTKDLKCATLSTECLQAIAMPDIMLVSIRNRARAALSITQPIHVMTAMRSALRSNPP